MQRGALLLFVICTDTYIYLPHAPCLRCVVDCIINLPRNIDVDILFDSLWDGVNIVKLPSSICARYTGKISL